jgi:pyruvate,water dikinase
MTTRHILPLSHVGMRDIDHVGGKNASLGEMIQNLSSLGIRIPDGFVISVGAYREFIAHNDLEAAIRKEIDSIDFDNMESLRRAGLTIRQYIAQGKFPDGLAEEISKAYLDLSGSYNQAATDVAVRSSATAEDLPDASFAGQQDTYLNVRGAVSLLDAVRNCFASLFTDRAISYRNNFHYDHFSIGLSIGVQKMVRSDLGTSGVAFSLDTESGFKNVVLINATLGLGEMLVQGSVSPDEYIVFKPALEKGFDPIIDRKLGNKTHMMIYGDGPHERTRKIPVDKDLQHRFSLTDEQVISLASWVVKIENYYSRQRGCWTPMDVEWAIDGLTDELFIVQARPETIHSRHDRSTVTIYKLAGVGRELASGIAVGDRIGSGKVKVLYSLDKRLIDGNEFAEGDVLVTDMTDPDWEPIMKKASAIVTNKGGRTCHAAIVARELGVPAVVGCGAATEVLTAGSEVTVCCALGETGVVLEGHVPFIKEEISFDGLPATQVPVMLNIGSPDIAFRFAHYPHRGVGLAREEFIINNYIGIHPLALLRHTELGDKVLSDKIVAMTRGYASPKDYFIERLASGIARIAAAFYPEKVIVRFSDFKTNEYYNLIGGNHFEPKEENPMIGWRGASRYYSPQYVAAFEMECKAILKVREKMGLNNVAVMIPFCRTVEELLKVKQTMASFGLDAGKGGRDSDSALELYLMAELPSNVMMAEEFARHIDGFSIGSNDLTQLTLGLDRDSHLVAGLYDERNDAVKRMIKMLIASAKAAKVKVGICGQGPSDFPDFTRFLVESGIDSVSVTPDALVRTLTIVSKAESVWVDY